MAYLANTEHFRSDGRLWVEKPALAHQYPPHDMPRGMSRLVFSIMNDVGHN